MRIGFMAMLLAALIVVPANSQSVNDRSKRLEALAPKLRKSETDSLAAVDQRVKAVRDLFDVAKRKTNGFAQEVVGIEGKLRFVGNGLQQAAGAVQDGVNQLLGNPAATMPAPDDFAEFVRGAFERGVLDSDQLKRDITSEATGYSSRLKEIESRLLIDVKADLDDKQLEFGRLPELNLSAPILDNVSAVVAQAEQAATADFLVLLGKEAVSDVGGKLLAGAAMTLASSAGMGNQGGDLQQMLVGIAGALVADHLVDRAVDAAGYNPVAIIATRVDSRLDQTRDRIVDGNAKINDVYIHLLFGSLDHPNERVRSACRNAVSVMERKAPLGFRTVLLGLHHRRSFARRVSLIGDCLGEIITPGGVYFKSAAFLKDSEMITLANDYAKHYEGGGR